uniref:Uncharacterized protein n=1 Tax=Magallana gigas TaxID=29159 RepID=A0A8W8JY47_MAGGI
MITAFVEELWAGLSSVARSRDYQWHKRWPSVDTNMMVKVKLVMNGGKSVEQISVKLKDWGCLSADELLKLRKKKAKFNRSVGDSFVGFQWSQNEFLQHVLDFSVPSHEQQNQDFQEERGEN